jgi:hypothetical protein
VRFPERRLACGETLGRDVGLVTGVVRRHDRDVRVRVLDLVQLDLAERAQQLHRRFPDERAAAARLEAEPDQCPDAAARELAGYLLDEGPGGRLRPDQHLPAGSGLMQSTSTRAYA